MSEKEINQKGKELIKDMAKTSVEISEAIAEVNAALKK